MTGADGRVYRSPGMSYLVCPRLLELDPRHGQHPDRWLPCRRGNRCMYEHEHETELVDPEGHTANLFIWPPGGRPPTPDEHPTCGLCGKPLVHADLLNLYDPELLFTPETLPAVGENGMEA